MLTQRVQCTIFDALEQIWVTTAFAELHDDIQNGGAIFSSIVSRKRIQISQQKLFVQLLLHLGHSHHDNCLRLWGQSLGNVRL